MSASDPPTRRGGRVTPENDPLTPLERLEREAVKRRAASRRYRRAALAALAALEAEGVPDPYAQLAQAAGMSRQAIRQQIARWLKDDGI